VTTNTEAKLLGHSALPRKEPKSSVHFSLVPSKLVPPGCFSDSDIPYRCKRDLEYWSIVKIGNVEAWTLMTGIDHGIPEMPVSIPLGQPPSDTHLLGIHVDQIKTWSINMSTPDP
jgi:hypothetical protein